MACRLKGRFVLIRMAPATEDDDGGDEIEEVDDEEEEEKEAATSPPPPRGRVIRGCVSKQNRRCTQNAKHCRDDTSTGITYLKSSVFYVN